MGALSGEEQELLEAKVADLTERVRQAESKARVGVRELESAKTSAAVAKGQHLADMAKMEEKFGKLDENSTYSASLQTHMDTLEQLFLRMTSQNELISENKDLGEENRKLTREIRELSQALEDSQKRGATAFFDNYGDDGTTPPPAPEDDGPPPLAPAGEDAPPPPPAPCAPKAASSAPSAPPAPGAPGPPGLLYILQLLPPPKLTTTFLVFI